MDNFDLYGLLIDEPQVDIDIDWEDGEVDPDMELDDPWLMDAGFDDLL